MQFRTEPPQPKAEAVVPMINVVFLLLVFFMMTSQIAPPAPVDVTPPTAALEATAEGQARLFITGEGTVMFEEAEGDAAIEALAALAPDVPLTVAADAALPVVELARLLKRLPPDLPVELLVQP